MVTEGNFTEWKWMLIARVFFSIYCVALTKLLSQFYVLCCISLFSLFAVDLVQVGVFVLANFWRVGGMQVWESIKVSMFAFKWNSFFLNEDWWREMKDIFVLLSTPYFNGNASLPYQRALWFHEITRQDKMSSPKALFLCLSFDSFCWVTHSSGKWSWFSLWLYL